MLAHAGGVIGKRMPRFLILFGIILALSAKASEPVMVHEHYKKISGVLPAPYDTFDLEIALNEETDDALYIDLRFGATPIILSQEDLLKFKDLELGSLKISHEIHREKEGDTKPPEDYMKDFFYMQVETGAFHRIEWQEGEKKNYQWGRKTVNLVVTDGARYTVYINEQQRNY